MGERTVTILLLTALACAGMSYGLGDLPLRWWNIWLSSGVTFAILALVYARTTRPRGIR